MHSKPTLLSFPHTFWVTYAKPSCFATDTCPESTHFSLTQDKALLDFSLCHRNSFLTAGFLTDGVLTAPKLALCNHRVRYYFLETLECMSQNSDSSGWRIARGRVQNWVMLFIGTSQVGLYCTGSQRVGHDPFRTPSGTKWPSHRACISDVLNIRFLHFDS